MPDGIERMVRQHLQGFAGYSASTNPEVLAGKVSVPSGGIVKLNANENPYGCSPKVLKALADTPAIHIYPDDGQLSLRRTIATYAGFGPEYIIAGHGSNTLIDYIVRLFVGPGDEVINCTPTFDLYRFSTQMYGGTVVNIPRGMQYEIDVAAVKAAVNKQTKLIFIASPNNPTGNVTPMDDIVAILETGVPIVVDEAYYEFHGETAAPYMKSYPNLMILRSFSKWAGLAGLRVGYGILPPRIVEYLLAIKIPHNVSITSEIAVRESLVDLDFLKGKVAAIVKERARLYEGLQTIPYLNPYPSQANFIYCTLNSGDATVLHDTLESKGILIRNFKTAVRISVGTPEQTNILMAALRDIRL